MKRKLLEYLKKIDSKEEEFIKNEKNVLAPYVIKKGSSVIDTDKMSRRGYDRYYETAEICRYPGAYA